MVGYVGFGVVLLGIVWWFGYRVGHADGWLQGIKAARFLFNSVGEMMEVPYPKDVNVAQGILEALEEDEEKRGKR